MIFAALKDALLQEFEKHRIVFLDDREGKSRDDFEALDFENSDIEKISLNNNEFSVKYQVLVKEPETKFLIYRENGAPEDKDNWLLDLQLSCGVFMLDQDSIRLNELGLDPFVFRSFIQRHESFFANKELKTRLQKVIDAKSETEDTLLLKMLNILSPLKKSGDLVAIILSLFKAQYELSEKHYYQYDLFNSVEENADVSVNIFAKDNGNLYQDFWDLVEREYGYKLVADIKTPVTDFIDQLFRFKLSRQLGDEGSIQYNLNQNAELLLNRWETSTEFVENLRQWAQTEQGYLNLESRLKDGQISLDKILEIDLFPAVDEFLIEDLLSKLNQDRDVPDLKNIERIATKRSESKLFYEKYVHEYQALENAAKLKDLIADFEKAGFVTVPEAVELYEQKYFAIDEYYRHFCTAIHVAGKDNEAFSLLKDNINREYQTKFLRPLCQDFCKVFRDARNNSRESYFSDFNLPLQKDFYAQRVKPKLSIRGSKIGKIAVIISDGMRYEIGHELYSKFNSENRFEAKIFSMFSMIPSYTQLGMASLLPNEEIALSDSTDGNVFVDGKSAAGIENRAAILASGGFRTWCVKAEDILKDTVKHLKTVIPDYDVIYIYHNVVDKAGEHDDARLFEQCDECEESLSELIRKLTSANINNLIVTSDHGFISVDRKIDTHTDCIATPTLSNSLFSKERFIITDAGAEVDDTTALVFKSEEIGLKKGHKIAVPASMARFSRQGQLSSYCHGGVSLQECLVPVIEISKKREDNVSEVEVSLISNNRMITSNQITVTLYQQQAVSPSVKKVKLRIGFYESKDGRIPCSNTLDKEFNCQNDNLKEREFKAEFVMRKGLCASKVYLRIDKLSEERLEPEPYLPAYEFTFKKAMFEQDDFDL